MITIHFIDFVLYSLYSSEVRWVILTLLGLWLHLHYAPKPEIPPKNVTEMLGYLDENSHFCDTD